MIAKPHGAGLACARGSVYAEFAAMVPVAGSAYAYATLGELAAWIIGWCLILEYLFASAMVAIGWAGCCGGHSPLRTDLKGDNRLHGRQIAGPLR